jgi:(p)ppGpp synthase/HD superfamily hydrolase
VKIEDAIRLACFYHHNQVDKIGEPYILHPIRVMLSLNSESERVVAVLHDILEDTNCTAEDLITHTKITTEELGAIEAITKREGESYSAYLLRVAENPLAIRVKRADISDNLSPIRLYKLPLEKRTALREKYMMALNMLDSMEGKSV